MPSAGAALQRDAYDHHSTGLSPRLAAQRQPLTRAQRPHRKPLSGIFAAGRRAKHHHRDSGRRGSALWAPRRSAVLPDHERDEEKVVELGSRTSPVAIDHAAERSVWRAQPRRVARIHFSATGCCSAISSRREPGPHGRQRVVFRPEFHRPRTIGACMWTTVFRSRQTPLPGFVACSDVSPSILPLATSGIRRGSLDWMAIFTGIARI